MSEGIRTVDPQKDSDGNYSQVRLVFGPCYFVELHREKSCGVTFVLGTTHHGFKADASAVNGELERIIYEIRQAHPSARIACHREGANHGPQPARQG